MPESIKVKNCPFCNCESHMVPILFEKFAFFTIGQMWRAECMNPECWAEGKAFTTPEAAAAFWNRREYAQSEIET